MNHPFVSKGSGCDPPANTLPLPQPLAAANITELDASTLLLIVAFNVSCPTAQARACYAELLFRRFLTRGAEQDEANNALSILSSAEHEAYDVLNNHSA
jgi:hypothetical protein